MSEEETTTQLEEKAIDSPHPLYIPLWRIAVALEEQNRFNWQWLEQNKAWHEEGVERVEQEKEESAIRRAENMAIEHERIEHERRLVVIHEGNIARDQAYREEMLRRAEEQARLMNETIQESYEAYLSSLKSPNKELIEAVGKALANDMRQDTGKREL